MGFWTDLGSVATGAINRDREKTAEKFKIRAEELKAKRDAIIEMKKVKYNDEIAEYKKNKEKLNNLNMLKSQVASGEIDATNYGFQYLMATKGAGELAKLKEYYAKNQKGLDDYLASIGKSNPLNTDSAFTNFKERNVIDSNYMDAIEKINNKYSTALKNAKNDSFLINKLVGERDKEIYNLNINEDNVKKNIETAEKVNEIETDTKDSKLKTDFSNLKITDKERVYGVPQWWKDDSKFADVKKDIKKDIDTASKQLTNTSYESLRDLGINIKPYVRTEQGRVDGAVQGFKGEGIKFNKTVGLITNQALNFQTDAYLFNKTGEDANKLTSYLSFPDTKNIGQDRIKSYSGVNTVLNTRKGFLGKDNFLGIVPFSVVGLDDVYIPTEGDALKFTGETKTVGAAYFNALKTISERNDPEFKKSTQGEAMNALQEKLSALRPGENSTLLNDVKVEMEKQLKLGQPKPQPNNIVDIPEGQYYEIDGRAFEINETNTNQIIEQGGNPNDFKKMGKRKQTGGDGEVAEKTVGVNPNVFKDDKIRPTGELGDTMFNNLSDVLKILPEPMSGKEIKEKYTINFPINEFSTFRPLK